MCDLQDQAEAEVIRRAVEQELVDTLIELRACAVNAPLGVTLTTINEIFSRRFAALKGGPNG